MTRFEEKLRQALKPEEPPPGFAERVIARARDQRMGSRRNVLMHGGLQWAAAGALCVLLAVAGLVYRQRQAEIAQSKAAKQQLMLALQIAGEQLQYVQLKITRP